MKETSINLPCFFMVCTDRTEKECLDMGLFGGREYKLPYLKIIKEGDIGFLLNIYRDELIGIFKAESPGQLNIVPEAWNGEFPAQVKVKLIGNLQRIQKASSKLDKIIHLRKVQRDRTHYYVPSQITHGPDITNKILALFNEIPDELKLLSEAHSIRSAVPNLDLNLDEVAGLKDVKDFIRRRIIQPFIDEELAYKLKLKIGGGILLVGPPGTGKTLIAMTIAKNIEAKFIEISPSLIVGYPGEAEKKLENIFSALENEPRAVVFLDEAEWILSKREHLTSSVMQRVIPVLLTQLSRIFKDKTKPVIVIAATNKPELIDEAFLRPGRFDKIFYVGLPDMEAIKELLKLQLKNRQHNLTDSDIESIAKELKGYSGADIEYIIDEAAFLAFERKDKINLEDIKKTIKITQKSVSPEVIKEIEDWLRKRGLL
ncbi:MAG: AAA family ATPase [Candidatus Kryptonium sp.]